jgi:dihydrodipicolinate reductase
MIKIELMGFGETGREVAKELLDDNSVKLVCVFKYHDNYMVGKDVGSLLGREPSGVRMSVLENYESVIRKTRPHVIIDFAAKRSVMHYMELSAK